MPDRLPTSRHAHAPLPVRLVRLAVFLLPCALLCVCAVRSPQGPNLVLWLGAAFQFLGCFLALFNRRGLNDPVAPAIIMLYVIGLSWLLLGVNGQEDWVIYLAQGLLLVVPLGFFAIQCVRDSGGPEIRRARQLVQHLSDRRKWPADLEQCRHLPEVKALREALYIDAAPVMPLLGHHRPQARVAALAALEFREHWRPGQAEAVLQVAQRALEPEVRAAAVFALGNVSERTMVESVAAFLSDPAPLVRKNAAEALLWKAENRWGWIRDAVRTALADPAGQADGPLRRDGYLLPPDAVTDLTAWSSEKGNLGNRAALTLSAHYGQAMAIAVDPGMVKDLRTLVTNPKSPAILRLELAKLLEQYGELDELSLKRMIDPSNPAPLRLIAVDALLRQGDAVEALAALYELARLPNREMALGTAEVVQTRLGVDLGIPRQGLPPVGSRQATEIARKLLQWATHTEASEDTAAAMWNTETGV